MNEFMLSIIISADDDWEKFVANTKKTSSLNLHTPKTFFDTFYLGNIVNKLDKLFQ